MRTFDVVVVGGGPNVAAMLARRDEVIGVDEHTGEPDEAVVLSGGSEPLLPPIDGLEDVDGVWTDREALTTREIPRRMINVGAGAVGLELAQAFQKLGSQVTLIEGEPRVLLNHEEFARFQLTTALGQDGVEILTAGASYCSAGTATHDRVEPGARALMFASPPTMAASAVTLR
jgi:pyruvate/2-oxoglutarate dehydrogenase complex dihydrolipoamide dehydrogenase (E3) component